MKGRFTSVSRLVDSSCLAFSAASRRRCMRHAVLAQVDAEALVEPLDQEVDDAGVEVLAAQEAVAAGGLDLVDALGQLQQRDVEGAAAQIVDRDLAASRRC